MKDITRLPQWAQARIRVAEMRQAEAEGKLATLFTGKDTDTYMIDGLNELRPLLKGVTIRFRLGDEYELIDVRVADDGLYVNGRRQVFIIPGASNAFTIKLEGRT